MKKLLWISLLVLWCMPLWAAEPVQLALTTVSGRPAPGASAAACSTQEDASAAADQDGIEIGRYAIAIWGATKVVVDSTYTICGIKINFLQVGTPASTLTACVYTDSAGVPSAQVGECSGAIAESTILTGDTYTFSVSASVSTGTYWIVLKRAANDESNYFQWRQKSGYCAGCAAAYNPTTWTAGMNTQQEYITYK